MSKNIKEQIDFLYKEIESRLNPGQFILNPEQAQLYKKIEALQKQCQHNYVDGVCEYCMMEES